MFIESLAFVHLPVLFLTNVPITWFPFLTVILSGFTIVFPALAPKFLPVPGEMTTSPTSFCVTVAGFGTAFVTLNIAVSEVKNTWFWLSNTSKLASFLKAWFGCAKFDHCSLWEAVVFWVQTRWKPSVGKPFAFSNTI